MSKEKIWEVCVEQIQFKPETRIIVKMTNEELIEALKKDRGDHNISIKNLKA